MSVDTLDDVIEEILDTCGIYGAHGDPDDDRVGETPCGGRLRGMCRVCASAYLHDKIRCGAEIEKLLNGKVIPRSKASATMAERRTHDLLWWTIVALALLAIVYVLWVWREVHR